jgi:hypothetical protein
VHPLPDAPAAAGSDVATMIYMISGFSLLGLFVVLLRMTSRKWNVAMLAAICGLLVISGVRGAVCGAKKILNWRLRQSILLTKLYRKILRYNICPSS